MVLDCGEPKIELTHATQLFNLINSLNYYNYDLSMQDEKQFFERYSVAYFWITSHRKVFELAKFADDHDGYLNRPFIYISKIQEFICEIKILCLIYY